MKKIGIILLIFLVLAVGIVYHYRYSIFQYSIETVIKNNLPPYLSIKSIDFDFDRDVFELKGIRIKNPKGFLTKFFVNVGVVSCRFRKKGDNIWDGIEITEIITKNPIITIERSEKGKVNLAEMSQVMTKKTALTAKKKTPRVKTEKKNAAFLPKAARKDVSNLVKLTDTIQIKNGEMFLLDRFLQGNIAKLRCEDITSKIKIDLSDDFTKVLTIRSDGVGNLNGDRTQRVAWEIFTDLSGARVKMSNTCQLENVDMTLLKPYYDKYSPVDIYNGRCSGTLVLNFDGDDIGSTNVLKIRNLQFRPKTGGGGFNYWQVPVVEIIKYLQSAPGEIIFDFKIKGNISDPRFYPGPYLKNALRNMVVDKVTNVIGSLTEDTGESDVDKVISVMKGIFGD
ncbi:MAG: DUF748 domain-containing protein [Candidatus Omnitrophica bacterium]|nr:DUF748 domain-containing protein [Candidatus Omnitrophota bacterium]